VRGEEAGKTGLHHRCLVPSLRVLVREDCETSDYLDMGIVLQQGERHTVR